MKKVKNLIIGAGISGLTYASYCKDDYLIIEKDCVAGGYCKTFYKKDFVWDYAGHFFHFKTEEFKNKFINSLSSNDYVTKEKKTYIYYKNKLIDYPFQMNIHELPKKEFIDCLYDLFNKEEKEEYNNFLDMLYGKFGKSITDKFLKPYNEKLYAIDLTQLDKDAMGRFFPYADKEAIIKNMKVSNNTSYNNTFMYPKKGAQVIINILLNSINKDKICLNTTISKIEIKEKIAYTSNGEQIKFENLINTIPFNQFLKLLNDDKYLELSNSLTYNKILVFNLGFNKKSPYNKENWIYYPDKNINFYRAGFYDNILDGNKLSMYIEIGYPKDYIITNDEIDKQLKLTLNNLEKTGIINKSFKLEEYMSIIMDPAYVHISKENDAKVRKQINDFTKNNIYSIGRYGAWTYGSMEDSMLEAKNLAEKLSE